MGKPTGRPIAHGAAWLAVRTERNRVSPRARRLMRALRNALDANPMPTLCALLKERITKRELALQLRETAMIADPSDDGSKWLMQAWNAQRRDIEALAVLVQHESDDRDNPDLDEYLRRRRPSAETHATAGNGSAPSPPSAGATESAACGGEDRSAVVEEI